MAKLLCIWVGACSLIMAGAPSSSSAQDIDINDLPPPISDDIGSDDTRTVLESSAQAPTTIAPRKTRASGSGIAG